MSNEPAIVITDQPLSRDDLARVVDAWFKDMVKIVVDVRNGTVGVGGELHADAEALLLEGGASQEDLWGANYYPGRGAVDCIEYTALINIRPAQDNPGMEIADEGVRAAVRDVVTRLIGTGDAL